MGKRNIADGHKYKREVYGIMNDFFFAVKSNDGSYWTGYNQWDKQIRKAKLFVSMKYANEVVKRYQDRDPEIVKVEIREVQEDE